MTEIPYTVPAVLKVDSDWGSVVLVSNKAAIAERPGTVYPPNVYFTASEVFFGEQNSFQAQKVDIPFNIIGSTEPVDIITAHGDASSGSEPGNVTVELFESAVVVLFNDDNNGDGVNAKVFSKVPLYIRKD